MNKSSKIGLAVLVIAIIGTSVGLGVFLVLNQSPSPDEDVAITIWGSGTTGNFTLTMSDLQSSKYQQFENLFYARSIDKNGTFSGVSIRDILEKESLLGGGAINYTFIASDGFNSAVAKGYYLNITELMNADYDQCIFAYGGDSLTPEDGPIRSIVNMTVHPTESVGAWWNRNCVEMQILT